MFHILQIKLLSEIVPRLSSEVLHGGSIWRYGTLCKLDSAIALVQFSSDHQSILAHACGDSDSSKAVRALMQRVVRIIQATSRTCQGLNFNLEHCTFSGDQATEHQTLPQSAVLSARERGARSVFSLDGAVETISKLLAFDNNGKE